MSSLHHLKVIDNFFFSDKSLPVAEQIAQTLAKVGPSLLLTSTSEILCFAIGMFLRSWWDGFYDLENFFLVRALL